MELIIKQYLKAHGQDSNKLAELLGKSQPAISLQLNGNPRVSSLKEIADALNCEIADLFYVPDGYVHWTQKQQYDSLASRCETLEQEMSAMKERNTMASNSKWTCPNCGMALQIIQEPKND